MGETAENLVDRYDISREEQDEFALSSQQKAAAGVDARAREIVEVEAAGASGKDTVSVTADEHPRGTPPSTASRSSPPCSGREDP